VTGVVGLAVEGEGGRGRGTVRGGAPGVAKDVHDRLTGHGEGDVSGGYGSGHALRTLAEAVRRLPLPPGLVVDGYRDEAVGILGKDAGGHLAITRVALHPSITFGGEQRQFFNNFFQPDNPTGIFNFTRDVTTQDPNGGLGDNNQGNPFATLLVGYPSPENSQLHIIPSVADKSIESAFYV